MDSYRIVDGKPLVIHMFDLNDLTTVREER